MRMDPQTSLTAADNRSRCRAVRRWFCGSIRMSIGPLRIKLKAASAFSSCRINTQIRSAGSVLRIPMLVRTQSAYRKFACRTMIRRQNAPEPGHLPDASGPDLKPKHRHHFYKCRFRCPPPPHVPSRSKACFRLIVQCASLLSKPDDGNKILR